MHTLTRTERPVRIADRLWDTVAVMAREMAVSEEEIVNQALFSWARINGYLEPSSVEEVVAVTGVMPVLEPDAVETEAPPLGGTDDGPVESTVIRAVPTELTSRRVFVIHDGVEYEVTQERFIIGRDALADLVIDSQRLSRHHAAIVVSGLVVEIEDLRSSNGTWFDGHPVTRRVVQSGEVYHLAEIPVRVELRAGAPQSKPAIRAISLDGLDG